MDFSFMTFYNFFSLNSTCRFCVNHVINQDSREPFDGQTMYTYFLDHHLC